MPIVELGDLQGSRGISKFRRITPPENTAAKFVDLAPTATADKAEIYFEALDYATRTTESSTSL